MVFTQIDAGLALIWAFWSYYYIEHKSPWGYWTQQARIEYIKRNKQTGNISPTEAGWGILWLFVPAPIAAGSFLYFREFESSASQGVYIANFIVIVITTLAVKIWKPLFFDYKEYSSATFTIGVAIVGNITNCVLVGISEAWITFALYMMHLGWVVYLMYVSIIWQMTFDKGKNTKKEINKY